MKPGVTGWMGEQKIKEANIAVATEQHSGANAIDGLNDWLSLGIESPRDSRRLLGSWHGVWKAVVSSCTPSLVLPPTHTHKILRYSSCMSYHLAG